MRAPIGRFMCLATAVVRCGRLKWVPRLAAPESGTVPGEIGTAELLTSYSEPWSPHIRFPLDIGMARVGLRRSFLHEVNFYP